MRSIGFSSTGLVSLCLSDRDDADDDDGDGDGDITIIE